MTLAIRYEANSERVTISGRHVTLMTVKAVAVLVLIDQAIGTQVMITTPLHAGDPFQGSRNPSLGSA